MQGILSRIRLFTVTAFLTTALYSDLFQADFYVNAGAGYQILDVENDVTEFSNISIKKIEFGSVEVGKMLTGALSVAIRVN